MATEVKLSNLGEEIEDVTINRWLVKEGDTIQEGDVIVEVATDKVDTEVPAPTSGVVLKLNFSEGELAPADAVLAVIGEPGEEVVPAAAPATEAAPAVAPVTETVPVAPSPGEAPKASPVAQRVAAEKGVDLSLVTGTGPGGQITKEDVLAYISAQEESVAAPVTGQALPGELADVASLPVRRIAAEHDVDLRDVAQGRPFSALTKYDVLSYIESQKANRPVEVKPAWSARAKPAPQPAPTPTEAPPVAPSPAPAARPAKPAAPAAAAGSKDVFVPHARMRKIIARNTTESAFTIPHVTTMWDVNMSAVLAHRRAHKAEFAKAGAKLTVTAYLIKAIVAGLKAVPAANASWTEDGVIIRGEYNIGMAVALPPDEYGMGGLIVPVIKQADELSLLGVAHKVNELAERARNNQLTTDDLQGGTFTLSNYGTSGSRFQTPIIVQPQAGILGVGAIEKRAIVVSQGHPLDANTGDYMTFAPMTTLGFSYDHRILDGASADAFCKAVKEALESWGSSD
jgi:2-oxoglutarate dehydrogenase E2 component (dihydrolipoamide succinyltransferase)